jgi:NADPH:quinone reductase-like Zn-dependent oxidoreductase
MEDVPQPRAAGVVVRIAATSFNPIDPKRASGMMR